jgi:hypothetical protein
MFSTKNLVLSAALVVATALAPAAQAGSGGVAATSKAKKAATTATCEQMKANINASALDVSSTASTTFVDVPESTVSFSMGPFTGCAIVNFSAMTFAPGDALLLVRALLDGVTVSTPGETQMSGDDDEDGDGRWSRSHDYNFLFTAVAPGPHKIKMQFRSFDGKTVFINRHTTVVYHR